MSIPADFGSEDWLLPDVDSFTDDDIAELARQRIEVERETKMLALANADRAFVNLFNKLLRRSK